MLIKDREVMSDAMRVLKDVWDGADRVKPFSELRLRQNMGDAMDLVIKGGLHFDKEDFKNLYDNFHTGRGYYITSYLGIDEHFYTVAVEMENISACQSFEFAVNRKPFITNNVKVPEVHYCGHFDITKLRSRLTVGSQFDWNGQKVTVTSFSKDNSYLCAVTYKKREREPNCRICGRGGWETGEHKIEHLYKITHDDLKTKTIIASGDNNENATT